MRNTILNVVILFVLILTSCNSNEKKFNIEEISKDKLKLSKVDNIKHTTNIDLLVEKASKSGSPDDLTKLWSETLKLKQWNFITKYKTDIEESKPFIGIIDNQPWVFIFTDRDKAQKYCLQEGNEGFADDNGNVYIISIDTEKAIEYVLDLQSKGVYGIRINEGNGWFSPISNLIPIIEYIKKQNK